MMKSSVAFVAGVLLVLVIPGSAKEQADASAPRRLTLQEAVALALKHNHNVRITAYQVEEKEQAKEVARSRYFPTLQNQTRALRVTDSQFIQLPQGSLGSAAGVPIPNQPVTLNQGGHTFIVSGTELDQPLTQLFTRVKPGNDIAAADLDATRASARDTQNKVALQVHELYYKVLIAQLHRSAAETKIKADQDLESERVEQVKYGSTLEEELIDSRAQSLEAQQDLLNTDLQLSDLTMDLDDAMGLPLETKLVLDPAVPVLHDVCTLAECIKATEKSHPEIVAARADVEKVSGALRLSKADYIPDVSAFARYSYQDNVPFLARNFGTFGVQLTYDLFDAGRRRATVRESDAQLAQAQENLARITEEAELRVQAAYNKLERTKQMVHVSEQVLVLRQEASRVSAQQLERGAALKSDTDGAVAREFEAKALLLQSQLDYIAAGDELVEATGQTPQ
jgi:outer membrane protein TolC